MLILFSVAEFFYTFTVCQLATIIFNFLLGELDLAYVKDYYEDLVI